ncbi:MAG: hypothetical protein EA391_00765 [Balneolaceae bacterium]|nr:MAG: hypothetical protein EA391_00765 [Balneolaceae bacterium]
MAFFRFSCTKGSNLELHLIDPVFEEQADVNCWINTDYKDVRELIEFASVQNGSFLKEMSEM